LYEGVGIKPRTGNKVTVHYSGKLLNGQVFDSSIQRGTPYEMELGVDPVIEGWVETLMDMRPGEGRMVVIPPELAYGEKSAGNVIGPNSWLIFEIQLLNVE
jgi:FKBP-type peptidyl-prolyl cis-trans isomerase